MLPAIRFRAMSSRGLGSFQPPSPARCLYACGACMCQSQRWAPVKSHRFVVVLLRRRRQAVILGLVRILHVAVSAISSRNLLRQGLWASFSRQCSHDWVGGGRRNCGAQDRSPPVAETTSKRPQNSWPCREGGLGCAAARGSTLPPLLVPPAYEVCVFRRRKGCRRLL